MDLYDCFARCLSTQQRSTEESSDVASELVASFSQMTASLAHGQKWTLLPSRPFHSEFELLRFLKLIWKASTCKPIETALFGMVEASKHCIDSGTRQSSVNAATLLNFLGVSFSMKNLQETYLNGADLSGVIAQETDFRGADLRNANFQNAFLKHALFTGANLQSVQFGERAYLTVDTATALAFSPDDRLLAIGTWLGGVILHDIETASVIRTLETSAIACICFSPDGASLATSGHDSIVRIWEVSTGLCKQSLQGHEACIWSIFFANNGRILLTGSEDKTARIWDLADGKCQNVLKGHQNAVLAATFSPDNLWIVTAGGDRLDEKSLDTRVLIWENSTDKIVAELADHTAYVSAIIFSLDGLLLVTGGGDQTLCVWNTKTWQCMNKFDHSSPVRSIKFCDSMIVTGGEDGVIRAWCPEGKECVRALQAHPTGVVCIAVSSTGNCVASSGEDSTIRFWEAVCIPDLKQHPIQHRGEVTDAIFSRDGRWLATASTDKTARLWEVSTYRLLQVFEGHTEPVNCVRFSHNGKFLATGSCDRSVRIWETANGQCKHVLREYTLGSVTLVGFSPDGRKLASLNGALNRSHLWNTETGECEMMLEQQNNSIFNVSFTPEGKWFPLEDVFLEPYGRVLPSTQVKSGLSLFLEQGDIRCVSFSPDGLWLVAGTPTKFAVVDVLTLKSVSVNYPVRSVAFSPDSLGFATGGVDQTVRCWRILPHKSTPFGVHLQWASNMRLLVEDADFSKVLDMSINNSNLLRQHRAKVDQLTDETRQSQPDENEDIILVWQALLKYCLEIEHYAGALAYFRHLLDMFRQRTNFWLYNERLNFAEALKKIVKEYVGSNNAQFTTSDVSLMSTAEKEISSLPVDLYALDPSISTMKAIISISESCLEKDLALLAEHFLHTCLGGQLQLHASDNIFMEKVKGHYLLALCCVQLKKDPKEHASTALALLASSFELTSEARFLEKIRIYGAHFFEEKNYALAKMYFETIPSLLKKLGNKANIPSREELEAHFYLTQCNHFLAPEFHPPPEQVLNELDIMFERRQYDPNFLKAMNARARKIYKEKQYVFAKVYSEKFLTLLDRHKDGLKVKMDDDAAEVCENLAKIYQDLLTKPPTTQTRVRSAARTPSLLATKLKQSEEKGESFETKRENPAVLFNMDRVQFFARKALAFYEQAGESRTRELISVKEILADMLTQRGDIDAVVEARALYESNVERIKASREELMALEPHARGPALLSYVGKCLQLPSFQLDENGCARLKIDALKGEESYILDFEYSPSTNSLLMYSELERSTLSHVDSVKKRMLYEALLESTLFKPVGIGFDRKKLNLVYSADLSVLAGNKYVFMTLISNFVNFVEYWDLQYKRVLANLQIEPQKPLPDDEKPIDEELLFKKLNHATLRLFLRFNQPKLDLHTLPSEKAFQIAQEQMKHCGTQLGIPTLAFDRNQCCKLAIAHRELEGKIDVNFEFTADKVCWLYSSTMLSNIIPVDPKKKVKFYEALLKRFIFSGCSVAIDPLHGDLLLIHGVPINSYSEIGTLYKQTEAFVHRIDDLEKYITGFDIHAKIEPHTEVDSGDKLAKLGTSVGFMQSILFAALKEGTCTNPRLLEIKADLLRKFNMSAQSFVTKEQFPEATGCYEKALVLDPCNIKVIEKKAIALEKSGGQSESIVKCCEKVLLIDPNHGEALRMKGWCCFIMCQFSAAQLCFEVTLENGKKQDSVNANSLDGLKLVYENRGDFQTALGYLDEGIKAYPDYIYFYDRKGCIFWELGKYQEALECFNKAERLPVTEDAVHVFYNKGLLLCELGRYDEALYCLRKGQHLILTGRDYDYFYIFQSWVLLEMGNSLEAKKYAQLGIGAASTKQYKLQALPCITALYIEFEEYEKALEMVDLLITLEAPHPQLYSLKLKAVILAFLGRNEESMQHVEKLRNVNRNCKKAWLAEGIVRINKQEYDLAESSFQGALKVCPYDQQVEILRAKLARLQGEDKKTLEIVDKVLFINPRSRKAVKILTDFPADQLTDNYLKNRQNHFKKHGLHEALAAFLKPPEIDEKTSSIKIDPTDEAKSQDLLGSSEGISATQSEDKHSPEESRKRSQPQGVVGPSQLEGWDFEDVEATGNSFYDAVISQLKRNNHSFLGEQMPEGSSLQDFLRLRIQGRNLKPGEWADYREITNLTREFKCAVAIVDTREATNHFMYHFINESTEYAQTADFSTLPKLGQPLQLAFTGNHYLSVLRVPESSAIPTSIAEVPPTATEASPQVAPALPEPKDDADEANPGCCTLS